MPVDIRIRFGRVIRHIREEQEINQEEAADRCGLLPDSVLHCAQLPPNVHCCSTSKELQKG